MYLSLVLELFTKLSRVTSKGKACCCPLICMDWYSFILKCPGREKNPVDLLFWKTKQYKERRRLRRLSTSNTASSQQAVLSSHLAVGHCMACSGHCSTGKRKSGENSLTGYGLLGDLVSHTLQWGITASNAFWKKTDDSKQHACKYKKSLCEFSIKKIFQL